jgi:hypothetical protein
MIKLYQIHYDAASYKNCTHHPNIELVDNLNSFTVFFENAVILDKIPTYQGSDMVGVVSHQFDKKVRAAGNRRFDIKSFVESTPPDDVDVIGFHHRLTKQQIFHNDTRLRYNELFNYLMEAMEVDFRAEQNPRFVIMQNHFVARPDVYKQYATFLGNCVDWMIESVLSEWYWEEVPYKQNSDIDYTFHPFICERLFSTWLHINSHIKCKYYNEAY